MACNTAKDNASEFLVSVADIKLFDCVGGVETLMINGKTQLNTSLTQTIQTTSLYAGKGAQKVFEYNYQKELAIALEDAAFDIKYLAIQNGTRIVDQVSQLYTEKEITFDASGVAQLPNAIGVAQVMMQNGEYTAVPVVNGEIADLGFADMTTTVVYTEEKSMDTIVIDAKTFPRALKLVMNVDIFTNAGKVREMQITVPAFKPDGALELSLTTDGVASSTLNGSAIADNKGNYAYITFNNVEEATPGIGVVDSTVVGLATTPAIIDLDATASTPVKLTVLGIRGGIYSNKLIANTDVTFTSKDPNVATVDAMGNVAVGATATLGDETTIEVVYGTYKDVVQVEII